MSDRIDRDVINALIAGHFADRFPLEDYVVYDEPHSSVLIHPRQKQWLIVKDDERKWEIPKAYSGEEEEWQRLWKRFKKRVTIEERKNLKLQQTHLPLRYRGDMPEFH